MGKLPSEPDDADDGLAPRLPSGLNVEHQPASRSDLERFPPASATCRRVREMLRDYADGDLSSPRSRDVEDHVHGCRECGLALSRAELEALRIRKALDAERAGLGEPGAGFTARVLARIHGDQDDGQPSAGFTSNVMQRVQKEWRRTAWQRIVTRIGSPGLLLLPLGAVVLLLLLGVAWQGTCDRVRVRVVAAHQATLSRPVDGGSIVSIAAAADASLAAGDRIETDALGSAVIERVSAGVAGSGAAGWRVEIGEASRIGVGAERLELDEGSFVVRAAEPLSLRVGPVAEVAIGPGWYDVELVEVVRFDQDLTTEPLRRVRLEAFEGRARIRRGGETGVDLRAGYVAHFDDWSSVLIEPGLSDERLRNEREKLRGADVVVQPAPEGWRGQIVSEVSGGGVADCRVTLHSARGTEVRSTDERGEFSFGIDDFDAAVAVLRVDPPSNRDDLLAHGPAPVRLDPDQALGRRLPVVSLRTDSPIRGRVLAAGGQPVADARVVPYTVDSLFAMADPSGSGGATTDVHGWFELRRVPRPDAPYQTIAVVVDHPAFPTTGYVLDATNVERGALTVVLAVPAEIRVAGLPPDSQVSIVQAVPGFPLRALASRHIVDTDRHGVATLVGVAGAPCWHVDFVARDVRRLRASGDGDRMLVPDEDATLGWTDIDRLELEEERRFELPRRVRMSARGNRFAMVETKGATLRQRGVTVRSGTPWSGRSRVYLRFESGQIRYLGETRAGSVVAYWPPEGVAYDLFAVGDDGEVGVLSSLDSRDATAAVSMRSAGGIVLAVDASSAMPETLAAEELIELCLVDGRLAGTSFWRVARATDRWRIDGLVPGTYDVLLSDGRATRVVVDPGAVAEARVVGDRANASRGNGNVRGDK
jgi:hypothetical protein